jgi:hypothetical protein
MKKKLQWTSTPFAACAWLLLALGAPRPALAQADGIDARATSLLKAATAYLAGQARLTTDTRSTIEVVLKSGQKIQFDHTATLSVERPNRLRAERRGDLVDQVFYYDGKSLTLHNPADNVFATVAAPGTLEEMLDFARDTLDIVAPAGDFLHKNAYDVLMQDVTSAFVVGQSVVEGVRCDHLAFRNPGVDWQLWIQEGAQPLPRRLVITSTDVMAAPQFTVVMTKWNLAPTFGAGFFDFTAPKDARRIDFLPAGGGTSLR